MARKTLANHLLKLSMYLLPLLLIVSLTIGFVCADSDSTPDEIVMTHNTDVTIEMIRTHVEKIRDKDPDIGRKLKQLEQKLGAGMSFEDSCTHCHMNEGRKP